MTKKTVSEDLGAVHTAMSALGHTPVDMAVGIGAAMAYDSLKAAHHKTRKFISKLSLNRKAKPANSLTQQTTSQYSHLAVNDNDMAEGVIREAKRGRPRKNPAPYGGAENDDRLGIHAALMRHKDQGERGTGEVTFANGESVKISPVDRDRALARIRQEIDEKGVKAGGVHELIRRMDRSKSEFDSVLRGDSAPVVKRHWASISKEGVSVPHDYRSIMERVGPRMKDKKNACVAKESVETKVAPVAETPVSKEYNEVDAVLAVIGQRRNMAEEIEARRYVERFPGGREALEEAFVKRHYHLIANILKDIPSDNIRRRIAARHGDMFHMDNPKFNRAEFYKNAGVVEPEAVAADDEKGKKPFSHISHVG